MAAFFKRITAHVAVAGAEQIEEDDGCGRLAGEELDARGGWMDAELQGVEVEAAVAGDDEFAIEDAMRGQLVAQRREDFRKVAIERFFLAALQQDLVAIAENEHAKAVPLGLEDPFTGGGNAVHALGEHGQDGGAYGEVHGQHSEVLPGGARPSTKSGP